MTEDDLDDILDAVPQYDDGRYRAVASRFIPGSVIGPFKYHGTRPDDAFWAAKQVAHFSEADIRALLAAAEYSDPAVEEELTSALLIRRDKIARAYLPHGGGIDRFHIEQDTLHFADLLDHPAFAEPSAPVWTTLPEKPPTE